VASLNDVARVVSDLVYGFEGTVVAGGLVYLWWRTGRHQRGEDLPLDVRLPAADPRDPGAALGSVLDVVRGFWPARAAYLYVTEEGGGLALFAAAHATEAEGATPEELLLLAPALPPAPLTLPAWQGAVEVRVAHGRELRGFDDVWLELPLAGGSAVVRLLGDRRRVPNRAALGRLRAACRRLDPFVSACLAWQRAAVDEQKVLAQFIEPPADQRRAAYETAASLLTVGQNLVGAADACLVVEDEERREAIALGAQAQRYAEVALGTGAAPGALELHTTTPSGRNVRLAFLAPAEVPRDDLRLTWLHELATFAGEVVALDGRASAFRDTYLTTLTALVRADEARHPHLAGHAHRVARYCRWLATAIGLSADETAALALAGYLHDVGMPFTSPDAPSWEGEVRPEAVEGLRRHPEVGALLVGGVPSPQPIADTVLGHHERWDGRGYPLGLADHAIPVGARILAVADRFDALTTSRSYRPALPFDEALGRLDALAGSALDPALVAAFRSAWSERRRGRVPGLPLFPCWTLKQLEGHVCDSCQNRLAQVVRCWEAPHERCSRHGDRCETCIVYTQANAVAIPQSDDERSVPSHA
jgi:hypothetical protein